MRDKLVCSDNQFGYRAGSGTDMCIFAFKEIVSHYRRLNTPIYICFIDVKSAFDRVSHWKLFNKLLDRGVSKPIVSMFVHWYTNQSLHVTWGEAVSERFHMSNGIRQGAVASPYFFNVVFDSLNQDLNASGVGCHIGFKITNNLSWADDLVLITPSVHALRDLLTVCDRFADENLVIYNTKKTKCMLVKSKKCVINTIPNVKLSGQTLEFVSKFKYLGHIICNTLSDNEDIFNQNRKLCARGNRLGRKYKAANVQVKKCLFQTFCSNIYCMTLWSSFTVASTGTFTVNYNNVLRRMLNLPSYCSASDMLAHLGSRGYREMQRFACHSIIERLNRSENSIIIALIHSDARM